MYFLFTDPDCKGKADGSYIINKATCLTGYRCSSSGMTRSSDITCTSPQLFGPSGFCVSKKRDGATCKG